MSRLTLQGWIKQMESGIGADELANYLFREEIANGIIRQASPEMINECKQKLEWLKELQHYKDLEEQGRLIELPCKVEDTVWAIFPTWTPMECEVVAIEILTNTVNIETKVVDSDADRIFWPADFGKTVFLTKEEAEAKLAELKGAEK